MVYTKENLTYGLNVMTESSKILFDDSAIFLSPKTESKSKKRSKTKLVEKGQLSQINECDDEATLQLEYDKLLRDIRAEIKYAESCAEFGDYLSQLISWSCSLPGVKDAYHEEQLLLTDGLKDSNSNLKPISNASSEVSICSQGRVESWGKAFEMLLADPIGIRCFQEFLKKEFSEENVLFWAACEKFKKTKDIEKMKFLAGDIFRNYLSPKGAFLVNVDQQAVKNVEENISTPNNDMFTTPQEQVFHLMKFDSFNRFLKSELYEECLLAETEDRLFPFEDDIDADLRKKSAWLKKSKSSLHESQDRKKNLLNFLSKGNAKVAKGPTYQHEKLRKERSSSLSAVEEFCRKNLSSPDSNGLLRKDSQLWEGFQSKSKCSFVRVHLPDGTSTMVVAQRGHTIRQSLKDVCEHKNIDMKSFDITIGENRQVTNPDGDISIFQDNVIYLEKRILFRFDLPNGRSVGIKANPKKTLKDVLQPVLRKNGFQIEDYSITFLNTRNTLALDSNISEAENKRLVTRLLPKKIERQNSDIGKPPMQDLRSSFRRFRSSSFKEDKVKLEKMNSTLERNRVEKDRPKPEETFTRKLSVEVKHLILGRTKSADDDGANALMSVLRKSQSGRLDDQRGMLPKDIELPDFLKVSSSTPATTRSALKTTNNSTHITSLKYPASPIIIESNHDDDSKDNTNFNDTLNSVQPSLYSVRSWRDMATPDQQLVNSSYISQDLSIVSATTTLSYDSIDSHDTLLELSRSDSLLTSGSFNKSNLCKENSAPPGLSVGVNKAPARLRANSYDNCEPNSSMNGSLPRTKSANHRPYPINVFNESDVLRELEYDVISAVSPKDTNLIPNSNNKLIQNGSCDAVPYNDIDQNLKRSDLALNICKSRSRAERLGSVDIVDYDLSPRASEANRTMSYPLGVKKKINENTVSRSVSTSFQSNVIPTPEKEKLLHGETIRGRQNEKITFV